MVTTYSTDARKIMNKSHVATLLLLHATDETLTLALPRPLGSDRDGGVTHYKQPDCNLDPERKL